MSHYRGVHLIESIVTVKGLKNGRNQHQVSPYRGVHLVESIVTVKGLKNGMNQHQVSPYRGVHLVESIVTVKGLENGRNQHQVSTLKRCPSYREYSYSKRTEKGQEPTPGVHLIEVSILDSIVTLKGLKNGRNQHQVSTL